MSQRILEKNIKRMQRFYPEVVALLEEKIEQEKSRFEVLYEKQTTEKAVLSIIDGTKKWNLTSRYENPELLENWINVAKPESFQGIVNIFGLGDGAYIDALLKETENDIYLSVYEPSFAIFEKVIQNVELKFLDNKRVRIFVQGLNADQFKILQPHMINYRNMAINRYMCQLNYEHLFEEEYVTYLKILEDINKKLVFGYNTQIVFKESAPRNYIGNIPDVCTQYGVEQLVNVLPDNLPVIIVSAGPSLAKNITQLKKAKNHSVILATDTALKPLLNQGVVPDMFVSIDPAKPLSLFQHEAIWKVPMVLTDSGNKEIVNRHQGKRFFSYDGNEFIHSLFQLCGKNRMYLETGGSVANNAFSFAKLMGAKTIILVGQDLAYEGKNAHIDGAFDSKEEEQKYVIEADIPVEGIDGNKVMTSGDLELFLKWFEKKIEEDTDIDVIDATEGGALIHGSRVMDLKEAIEQECYQDVFVFEDILDKIVPQFGEGEIEKILAHMKKIPHKLVKLENKIQEGISLYNKLERLFQSPVLEKDKIVKIQKKVKQMNRYIEKEILVSLIEPYIRSAQYKALSASGKRKEDAREDGGEVVKNALLYLNALLDALKTFSPDIEMVMDHLKGRCSDLGTYG